MKIDDAAAVGFATCPKRLTLDQTFGLCAIVAAVATFGVRLQAQAPAAVPNAMNNPFRMLENWPHLGDIKPGAAIGIVPDSKGGVWLQHRSDPGILHIDAAGNIVKRFEVTFASSHGLCQDRDGNFWAVDSGPFNDVAGVTGVKGNQVFKFDQNGKLLLTLGKAGVSHGRRRHVPAADGLRATPDGNIVIADGHWPRPTGEPAGRRSARLVHARRQVRQGVRQARDRSRASSWDRTVSPSIRRAGCSSPIDRTTAFRSSTRT